MVKKGHFRAGLHWPHEGKTRELTEDQVVQLKADPRIALEPVEKPEPKKPAAKKADEKKS
jgi:hypothetical protein